MVSKHGVKTRRPDKVLEHIVQTRCPDKGHSDEVAIGHVMSKSVVLTWCPNMEFGPNLLSGHAVRTSLDLDLLTTPDIRTGYESGLVNPDMYGQADITRQALIQTNCESRLVSLDRLLY